MNHACPVASSCAMVETGQPPHKCQCALQQGIISTGANAHSGKIKRSNKCAMAEDGESRQQVSHSPTMYVGTGTSGSSRSGLSVAPGQRWHAAVRRPQGGSQQSKPAQSMGSVGNWQSTVPTPTTTYFSNWPARQAKPSVANLAPPPRRHKPPPRLTHTDTHTHKGRFMSYGWSGVSTPQHYPLALSQPKIKGMPPSTANIFDSHASTSFSFWGST